MSDKELENKIKQDLKEIDEIIDRVSQGYDKIHEENERYMKARGWK